MAKEKKEKIFGKIESLNIAIYGVGFEFSFKRSLPEMERFVRRAGDLYVFIDEAQYAKDLDLFLAYSYDRLPNVHFILSGSEVRVREEVLGVGQPEHPLFGRHFAEVVMERLSKAQSKEFLFKGFEEVGLELREEEAEEVVENLDGLIGWLTFYGYERAILKNPRALKKTRDLATSLVASELFHFLKTRKSKALYLSILRKVDGTSWNQLLHRVSKALRKEINDHSFTHALKELERYSFIFKRDGKYYLADPLIFDATFKL